MKIFSFILCLTIISCSSSKVLQNQTHYAIDEGLLQQMQNKNQRERSPASVGETVSTKRIYFKSLYEQYLVYTQLSGVHGDIYSCPAFHLDFLETKAQDVVSSRQVSSHKVKELQRELVELCDKGVTANYYKFENLVQYHVGKKSFHQNPASIFSLLKIPVFHNMYDLKLAHNLVLIHPELIELSRVHWFTSYLQEFKIDETFIVKR